ncbi:MAG: DUF998 domain-containing protein [Caldimonas sp.]
MRPSECVVARPASTPLLAAGVILGPLFYVVVAVQAMTRTGYEVTRHPLSLLSLGQTGWIQISNFCIAGLLAIASSIGFRRALRGQAAGTWGPVLIGILGLGLITAGVFPPDPSMGFPPGAPLGAAAALSMSAKLHGVGFAAAFGALSAACFVFARRFAHAGRRNVARYSAATGIAIPVVIACGMSRPAWASLSFAAIGLVAFGWLAAVALDLIQSPSVSGVE